MIKLIDYLPYFYKENSIINQVQSALSKEITLIDETYEELKKQMFISTATYGLNYWEKMLKIPTSNSDYVTRRARIMSKLRGGKTTTIQALKDAIKLFVPTDVDIILFHNEYYFKIHFSNWIGIPNNIREMVMAIEEIKPAHLGIAYQFRFNTYGELSKLRHIEMNIYTHKQVNDTDILGINTKTFNHTYLINLSKTHKGNLKEYLDKKAKRR